MSITVKFYRLVIKVFDNWLHIKLGDMRPTPRKHLYKKYSIRKMVYEEHDCFFLEPLNKPKPLKAIVFTHGGGYLYPATSHHWRLAIELMEKTDSALVFTDYPLIPNNYKDATMYMDLVYAETMKQYEQIAFVGDSAGAGLIFGFIHHLKDKQLPPPHKMILISPWLDVSMENPDIKEIAKHDAWLANWPLKKYGAQYSDNDPKNKLASPIYGELKDLPKTLIITTDDDVLDADVMLLEKKKDPAWDVKVSRYNGVFHDFPLMGLNESKQARQEMVDFITNGDEF